jgi:hypothetical protein
LEEFGSFLPPRGPRKACHNPTAAKGRAVVSRSGKPSVK